MSKIDKLGVWIFMLNDELKKRFDNDYAFTIRGAGQRIAFANSNTNGTVVTPDNAQFTQYSQGYRDGYNDAPPVERSKIVLNQHVALPDDIREFINKASLHFCGQASRWLRSQGEELLAKYPTATKNDSQAQDTQSRAISDAFSGDIYSGLDSVGQAEGYCHDKRHAIPCPLPCHACECECETRE